MRWDSILRVSCAAILVCHGVSKPAEFALQRRQDGNDASPTLTSNEPGAASTNPPDSSTTDPPSDQSSSGSDVSTTSRSGSDDSQATSSIEPTSSSNSTSTIRSSSTRTLSTPSSAPSNGTTEHHANENKLPITPRITPALSVGGVVLIMTGVVYNLVGVKNRWVHVSLSAAYLASLAVTVLIDYVMSPPISDGIQGAYFVGIFMTGVIFGGGALIFKEVTEGLGCLLGGFCLSMWFLTLKSGGLITNAAGKGIFIAVFCVIAWSFSFSHYTRAYGLIGATSFTGSTAFVLGIDCFSRAGLKEFWFYIWGLNNNLFPLGTTTFPMTRGIRVEIIIIVLGTVIGVISQIKLWKIVRDKQKKKEAEAQDEERRKDVVEHALGRQIERQNDRDRSNWEKQFGNTLHSKRATVLWSEAHPDKSYTHITSFGGKRSSSSESVELASYGTKRQSKLKRQSSAPSIAMIPEEGEDQAARASMERNKAFEALQKGASIEKKEPANDSGNPDSGPEVIPLPFKIPIALDSPTTDSGSSVRSPDPAMLQEPKRNSKRRSLQSMLSLSPRLSTEHLPMSESQEALVLPEALHSRPSSVAATLDVENDLAGRRLSAEHGSDEPSTPKIVVSPATSPLETNPKKAQAISRLPYDIELAPPSPPALSDSFEFDDPEEMSRPVDTKAIESQNKNKLGAASKEHRLSKETKRSSGTGSGLKQSSDSYANSNVSTGQTSSSEVLTKGALDHVPNHLSNVVLSYRTNEWAKHISTADEPMFDEPETIDGGDDEAPTQLAPTSPIEAAQASNNSKTLTASSKPPAPHVVTSSATGNAVANVQPPQRSVSDQAVSRPSAAVLKTVPIQPIRALSSKAKRSSLGAPGTRTTLGSTPIDENVPTEFAPSQTVPQRSLYLPQRVLSSSSLAGSTPNLLSRSMSAQPGQMYPLDQRNSYASVDNHALRMSRSSSSMGNNPGMRSDSRLSHFDTLPQRPSALMDSHAQGFRSETRLSTYESRQPQKRQYSNEAARREQLLAEWRMSQHQGGAAATVPREAIDSRRTQMMMDKEHKRMMEDQAKVMHHQKQMQIEQVMRRPDMQEVHREAMRKMQAGASTK